MSPGRWRSMSAMAALILVVGCAGGEPVEPGPDTDEAPRISQLKAVDSADPMDLYRAGVALAELGEGPAAVEKLEAARKLAPENVMVRKQLAILYAYSGRLEEGIEELERTLDLDPDDTEVDPDWRTRIT